MDVTEAEAQPWPLRAAILALLGCLGGLAIHALIDGASVKGDPSLRYAAATFVGIALLAFGHGWVRGRLVRAVVVAVVAGLVVALTFLWSGTPTDDWSGGEPWRVVAAMLAVFLFVPLAQAGGNGVGFGLPPHWSPPGLAAWIHDNFDYGAVHEHGWTNLITGGLSVLFAGAFFLMCLLVGSLFDLVNVTFLKTLLNAEWVIAAIFGGAIGGSTGLLRDHRRIISALQGVAMTVLRMAAPVLAVALALFLAILPLTGLAPLWDATRSTTPILLTAFIIAFLLSNSVIGNGETGELQAPVLRMAALILAIVPAPLALIAAISTGLRVGQYGWTPERLWAATFVLMACVVAVAYLVALAMTRGRWMERLRSANLYLAFLICAVALLLSTPLVRFDAIATRDQIARLADGRTPPGKFDYHALWFEFGPAGRATVRHLARSGATMEIRRDARAVQGMQSRYAPDPVEEARRAGQDLDTRLSIFPMRVPLPPALRQKLADNAVCGSAGRCVVRYDAGSDTALVMHEFNGVMASGVSVLLRRGEKWEFSDASMRRSEEDVSFANEAADAIRTGKIEVRTEPYRRVYIDGKAFDLPFPVENAADLRSAP